jgi:hypothetical protein
VTHLSAMRLVAFILLALTIGLTGCKTPAEKEKARKAALTKKTKVKPREESSDVDFDAFVGRLRKAVGTRDKETLKAMMTPNFGYKLEPAMEGFEASATGPGVFQYWDDENLWPELDGILSEKFVKFNDYMVAPPQFADLSVPYDGYRAGIRRINGSWKFVYFVNGAR